MTPHAAMLKLIRERWAEKVPVDHDGFRLDLHPLGGFRWTDEDLHGECHECDAHAHIERAAEDILMAHCEKLDVPLSYYTQPHEDGTKSIMICPGRTIGRSIPLWGMGRTKADALYAAMKTIAGVKE